MTVRDVEYRIKRADTGELRWLQRSGQTEVDDQGPPVRFVGVALDISERKLSEERLRASEEQARLYRTESSWRWRPAPSSAPGYEISHPIASRSTKHSRAVSASIRHWGDKVLETV